MAFKAQKKTLKLPLFASGLNVQLNSPFDPNRIDPITKQVRAHNGADFVPNPNIQPAALVSPAFGKVTKITNEKWAYPDTKSIAGVPSSKWAGTNLYITLGKNAKGVVEKIRFEHLVYGSVKVKVGQIVGPRDIIGTMGTTGWSTGPHLHIEYWVGNTRVDPMPYLMGTKAMPQDYKPKSAVVPTKNLDEVAREVIEGPPKYKWGNGQERIDKLRNAGYDPQAVQTRVNALVRDKAKVTPVAPKPTPKPIPTPPAVISRKAGDVVTIKTAAPLYASSSTKKSTRKITGNYYLYDGIKVNGRYRITISAKRVKKWPAAVNVTGWIEL